MSSLLSPPKAFDKSDSIESSNAESTDPLNSLAALACLRNSFTIEGKHTFRGSSGWVKIYPIDI
uniref:Uncharacterized protein n=1 Tax=Arundo donax TaxID=35708 RepID=A0A0A9E7D6_ARUDO